MSLRSGLLCTAALLFFSACEMGAAPEEELAPSDTTAAGVQEDFPYEVVLYGVSPDTLRGEAAFGRVLERNSGREEFIIELEAGGGFAGGLYITRGDTVRPEVGTYQLADAAQRDSTLGPGRYVLFLQEGLMRQMASSGGQLTFDIVTDTLIAGSFDATLRGVTSEGGTAPSESEIRARGTFRAVSENVGYIVGLW